MRTLYSIIPALFTLASLFQPVNLTAQAPERISYQAVIRTSNNQLVVNQPVGMRISIQKFTFGFPPSYQNQYIETQRPTTNENGLVSIQIGGGSTVSGTFKSIDWANGTYYIQIETDPTGGSNYTISGKSQILSVPYALHAQTVGSVETDASLEGEGNPNSPLKIAPQSASYGQVLEWDGNSWKPGINVSFRNEKAHGFCMYEFTTGNTVPFTISYQDLGFSNQWDMRKFFILNLEVGWSNALVNGALPQQYRSLKDGIYYELCITEEFCGIKVYFPDKTEYWLKEGRILYFLSE